MTYLGVDLAWGEGTAARSAKETGVAAISLEGTVLDAGWTVGIEETVEWILATTRPGDVIAIDAPLVVTNQHGMRDCEREVGQRYGRWRVSANSTNLGSRSQGGVTLRRRLEAAGILYTDGLSPARPETVTMFECYPYTTLVGAPEFGYDVERPRYKRLNTLLPGEERRTFRAAECDELIRRLARFANVDPPVGLSSHPETARLVAETSPTDARVYKHREDLLDAVLCAWTAALWSRHGLSRCQVLGASDEPDDDGRRATIVAPAKPEQRRG